MKILDWLGLKPQVKENPVSQVIVMNMPGGGQSIGSKVDYASFAKEGYAKNDVVFRCVNEIASGMAGIPWYLQKRLRDGTLDEIDSHPLLDLINRPNPLQSRAQFLQWLGSYLMLSGNAYVLGVGPDDFRRPPQELYLLRPDRMKVIPHPTELVSGYEYKVGGESIKFDRKQILHLKLFNPLDDFYGMSPIQVAALAVDKLNNADQWNANLFQNQAVPSGLLKAKQRLTDDQFKRLKEEIKTEISGVRNARQPLLLEDDMDWKEMGMNARDLDFVNGHKMSAAQVARAYGVPLEIVGLIDATFENRKEARRYLYNSIILTHLDNTVLPGFNSWLAPRYGEDLLIERNTDSVEALSEDQDKLWKRVNEATFLDLNEKRSVVGWEPREGGDVLFVEVNKMPLQDAIAGTREEGPEEGLGDASKSLALELLNGCPEHGTEFKDLHPGFSGKAFTDSERKRYRRLFVQVARQRDRMATKIQRRVERLLKEDARALATAYKEGGRGEAVSVLARHGKENWQPLLERHHLDVMRTFGSAALQQLKAGDPDLETKEGELDGFEDLFHEIAQRYARENAAKAVTNISEATRNELNRVIESGIGAGMDTDQITDLLKERLDGLSKKRARSIARTETHGAQNQAQLEQIRALNQQGLQKGWLWSGVSRSEHAAVDGEWVDMEEKFNVGGAEMDRPGDPAGGPENVINCSCTLVFRRKP